MPAARLRAKRRAASSGVAYETSSGEVPARLYEALQLANAAIGECVAEDPTLNGMGCTLVGVAFGPAGVEWVSVGDSPLFLVRRGEIVLLNEDHSLAPEIDKLAASGKISWESARNDPRRHFLRSALTGAEIDLVDRSRRPLAMEPANRRSCQRRHPHLAHAGHPARGGRIMRRKEPDAIADALLGAVEAAADEHQDNTTVVVVHAKAD